MHQVDRAVPEAELVLDVVELKKDVARRVTGRNWHCRSHKLVYSMVQRTTKDIERSIPREKTRDIPDEVKWKLRKTIMQRVLINPTSDEETAVRNRRGEATIRALAQAHRRYRIRRGPCSASSTHREGA